MADEPIPIDAIMTDLNSQWNASNVTKPTLITVNKTNEPIRYDLNRGDMLIGRTGSPSFPHIIPISESFHIKLLSNSG